MTGCKNESDPHKVVARVGDEEITIRDVGMIYDLEEQELSTAVEHYVQEEVLVQEAKSQGIDIAEDLERYENIGAFTEHVANEERVKEKAEKLGMKEAEYKEIYKQTVMEKSAYINKYINMTLGKIGEEESAEDYMKRVNRHIENLLMKHSDHIEILVND